MEKLHYNLRQRLSAIILAMLMALFNIGFNLITMYGIENNDDITFSVYGTELVRSMQEAVSKGNKVRPENIEFTNGKIEEFQTLFFKNGNLYEVYPEFEEDGGLNAELRIFVHLTEEDLENGTKLITGDEELIFLYLNHTDETITCQTEVICRNREGKEQYKKFGRVTLQCYEEFLEEEKVDIATNDAAEIATSSKAGPVKERSTEFPSEEPAVLEEQLTTKDSETSDVRVSYREALLTKTALEIATPGEISDPEKKERGDLHTSQDNDLVGVNWCSTAKVYTTTLNKLKIFEEASGCYSQVRQDNAMEYQLQDTVYYEDDNIAVAFHIEGTAMAAVEESTSKKEIPVATPSEISVQNNLILEAKPMTEDQPEYKAIENYALAAGGEKGIIGLSAIKLNFYWQNQLLDVSLCRITAEITPKEPVIAAKGKTSAIQTFKAELDEPEYADSENTADAKSAAAAEASVAITVLESDGKYTEELGSITIAENKQTSHALSVSINSSDPMLLAAVTKTADPMFAVQYYANLDVVQTGNDGQLPMIDTSGKNLPKNGSTPKVKNIILTDAGNGKYQVSTTGSLTEIYKTREFTFSSAPGLTYFNILQKNENYTLKEIWVLKDGKDSTSTNRDDWNIKQYSDSLIFTNDGTSLGEDAIIITNDAVIRLVYDPTFGDYTNDVNFYDYDITEDGMHTYQDGSAKGINNSSNYGDGSKLAFGNANTGTKLDGVTWNGNTLNKSNSNGYKGCTFGLVTGLNENGTIRYANGVAVPNLFNEEGEVTGKTPHTDYNLIFKRKGDTYTLSSVDSAKLDGLEYFSRLSHYSNGEAFWKNTIIWTNNFWPMDEVYGKDPHSGECDNQGKYITGSQTVKYPTSDDSKAHNNMFGMQYALNFTLPADYTGPLEYYFFGDDDMWVFLDDTLVCDIGGVHSSVGQYVNLWDYLEKGSSDTHTLTFFYTERGLSGSSCYMQFTLPSVTSAIPGMKTGTLTVKKQVEGITDPNTEFTFKIDLKDENGNELKNLYPCDYPNSVGSIQSGEIFTLKAGESITLNGLPYGTVYTIEEEVTEDYAVSCQINNEDAKSSKIAVGKIDDEQSKVTVIYTNKVYQKLPETGGDGVSWFYTVGTGCILNCAMLFGFKKKDAEKNARKR